MRVVFLGNVADFSPAFLESIAARSRDPDDAVSVVAVVCPAHRPGRVGSAKFTLKRAIGRGLDHLDGRSARLAARLVDGGSGMHRKLQRLAGDADAEMFWPADVSSRDLCDRLADLDADVAIVAGLDRILREPTLAALPPIYNVHPSLLPEFRGAAPEFWQLDGGNRVGGVTIHRIDPGVDTGPIVLQRSFAIHPWYDATELIAHSVQVGIEMVDELLDDLDGVASGARPQHGGSYQPIPGDDAQVLPFDRTAGGVVDRARALGFEHPLSVHVPSAGWFAGEPVEACEPSHGAARLRLRDPVIHPDVEARPQGSVLRTARDTAVVWCAGGVVEFRRVDVDDVDAATAP